jgi:hypothetical protein
LAEKVFPAQDQRQAARTTCTVLQPREYAQLTQQPLAATRRSCQLKANRNSICEKFTELTN